MTRDLGLALLLILLGLSQMVGQVVGLPALAGLGLVSAASPAPKVFSSVDGLETFSSTFAMTFETADGLQTVDFDSALYARLDGPYNRRNPYGALLAYGPVLAKNPETAPMFWSMARYALCDDRPLLEEVGVDTASIEGPVTIWLQPRPGTSPAVETRFEVTCE